ncbi:hypothetical protein [Microbacterium sp. Se5.02b]|uniref:hypothetical protein n=1 Tax=Microbacterium sp. Se5.02b TaxID=2864103 RepID=UPI001C69188B|nr:hypothetical protein [Microbacterium sp. Se5.02b]QYM65193.1 hypothetical protein K1X59_05135 [Microbacterium sp. Se5.02b]
MTGDGAAEAATGGVSGSTTFSARALQRLAVGIVRDAAGVAVRDVGVQLSDHRGALRIAVAVPVARGGGQTSNLVEQGDALRRAVIDGMRDLAGRDVRIVDIRYAGVRRSRETRVR